MKPAIIIVCALVACAVLGVGAYYGYRKYTNHYAVLQAKEDAKEFQGMIPSVLAGHFPTGPGTKDVPTTDGHDVFSWSPKPNADPSAGPAWVIHCEKYVNGNTTPRTIDLTISRKAGTEPASAPGT